MPIEAPGPVIEVIKPTLISAAPAGRTSNDAIITLRYKVKKVLHWAVAEAVDNANPTSAGNPDAWRVSFEGFIVPTDDPSCYTSMLAPVQITPSGGGADIRVETGP